MTSTARAAILAVACDWQAEDPDRRYFRANSRSWGLSLDMGLNCAPKQEMAEVAFWESTPDADLTPDAIRSRIEGAWADLTAG